MSSTDTISNKQREEFRVYHQTEDDPVREFYRQNHIYQTVEFVTRKREAYLELNHGERSIWQGLEYLNTLVDESDPDTDLSQIAHLLQTSEAIRADGHPRWFVLTGLIHDLGKVLCLFGEPQWAVVGDTFPVGCQFSDKIIYPEFFSDNPDSHDPRYQDPYGIYAPNCGFNNLLMSWGHDEYIYQVVKNYLPLEALYMLRFHSFYAAHKEGEYQHLMDAQDHQYFGWVKTFNQYDLYSKSAAAPDVAALKPFYEDLIAEFFPARISF